MSGVTETLRAIVGIAEDTQTLDTWGLRNFGASLAALGDMGVDSFISAFDGAELPVKEAGKMLASNLETGIRLVIPNFQKAGQDAAQGLINGIRGKMSAVSNAGMDMGRTVVSATRKALDSHSPSEEEYKAGQDAGEGLRLGIQDSGKGVADAASTVAAGAVDATKSALSSLVPDEWLGKTSKAVEDAGKTETMVVQETASAAQRSSKAKAQAHINAGAKKVVISAPAGNDLPTIVYNVNHDTLTKEDTIISAASCTTNCLAPMAKALNDLAPVESGIMCTIHAYTGDQMILDGPQRKGDKRRSRAGAINIVPNSTGAAKAIGLVIPELSGKLIGAAQRVPTPTGSSTLLFAVVNKAVTKDEVNAAMKAASNESFGYNTDEIVSSDVVGMRFGSLFDATQTMVSPLPDGKTQVEVVSWYDNENSYTSQMVRTIKYFAELG